MSDVRVEVIAQVSAACSPDYMTMGAVFVVGLIVGMVIIGSIRGG